MKYNIPRIVLAAPQSSSGKTTIVTGILRALRNKKMQVQPYKIGPDYIDPSYHALAAGRAGHNLDTWLVAEEKIDELFIKTSHTADISIIEGVMGLYDGGKNGISSTAQLAKKLQAPVILVINCRSMGDSAAALALGFKTYDKDINFAGVILNCLGSDTHEQMIREAMEKISIPVLGAVRRDNAMQMPERHLGLTPAGEKDTEEKISYIAEKIAQQIDLAELLAVAQTASRLEIAADIAAEKIVKTVKIAVARDKAFSFYYEASLAVLEKYGAEIEFFSPLDDENLPECDAIILGGGFPELFVNELSANKLMLQSLQRAAANNMPIYAECGGFMYLMQEIIDFDGKVWPMAGIIPARAVMQQKLQTVGYVTAKALKANILLDTAENIRGHEFHFSVQEEPANDFPWAFIFTKNRNNAQYKAGYCYKNILASYLHMHFLGAPKSAEHFVNKAKEYKRTK
ncbi:cobyrinate a,c-diamide synthase [Pectinatus brassicae]|uniref:Cobyrinate a,c-diamide synthase n=1 Tax=Pectinatus brassicae TaxID=862415 RepID=A0A840UPN2_9FIRM|nr:cobyrinate a,c-diamide synthase [Pectinatus brassicae]MBB5336162.1 cobyrinic acid a,c-diamide synthase [Pectinatus brassicae]